MQPVCGIVTGANQPDVRYLLRSVCRNDGKSAAASAVSKANAASRFACSCSADAPCTSVDGRRACPSMAASSVLCCRCRAAKTDSLSHSSSTRCTASVMSPRHRRHVAPPELLSPCATTPQAAAPPGAGLVQARAKAAGTDSCNSQSAARR